jgi:uncharacterized phage infection (PIP) family protein YhgE
MLRILVPSIGSSARCRRTVARGSWRNNPAQIRQSYVSTTHEQSSSSSSSLSVELRQLRIEIRNLNRLVQSSQAKMQSIETNLNAVLQRPHETSSTLDQLTKGARDYVRHNEALKNLTEQINRQAHKYPGLMNWYTARAGAVLLLLVWWYWASIQQRTSEEVADIASKTLEQETLRQSIRDTVGDLAQSPDTQNPSPDSYSLSCRSHRRSSNWWSWWCMQWEPNKCKTH